MYGFPHTDVLSPLRIFFFEYWIYCQSGPLDFGALNNTEVQLHRIPAHAPIATRMLRAKEHGLSCKT